MSECSELCFADLNGDGTINVLDLVRLLLAFGDGGPLDDINCDGSVNVPDLIELLLVFGTSCP